ncbi:MAG: hypothetical protein ACE37F_03725 [Nannocystaceae bacterium]|nr:hypothetical protein [bacterium]
MDVPSTHPPTLQRSAITIDALLVEQSVRVTLDDARSEATTLFAELPEPQQRRLAEEAWQIGLRALGNAQAQARESKLEDIGKTLLSDVDAAMKRHVADQLDAVETAMKAYFDPQDGKVARNMAAFLADDGTLNRVLEEQLTGEHSQLARTLAAQVGEHSELFKRLDPDHKGSVVQMFEERLAAVLQQSQRDMAQALDPAAPDGALARVLTSLRKEMEEAQRRGAGQLEKAVSALDANDENSAIARLVKATEATQQELLRAINPHNEGSPMAAVRKVIADLLHAQGQSHRELLEQQGKRQQELDQYIRDVVARSESRKESDASSPRGGTTFEEQVVDFITAACGTEYIVEPTGSTTGKLGRCKVGDALVRFPAQSIFNGCNVVVEAKRDASYNAAKMLAEMERARENRGADVGLFVIARASAWSGAPQFARFGSTIFVQWDPEDPSSDAMLQAALFSATFMATRTSAIADKGDIEALQDVDRRIHAELGRIAKMRKEVDKIAKAADVLHEQLRIGDKKLHTLLEKAKATMAALDVELLDRELEVENPIAAPETSFAEPVAE